MNFFMENESRDEIFGRICECSELEIEADKLYRWFQIEFEKDPLSRYNVEVRVNVRETDKYFIGQKVGIEMKEEVYNRLIFDVKTDGEGRINFYE